MFNEIDQLAVNTLRFLSIETDISVRRTTVDRERKVKSY